MHEELKKQVEEKIKTITDSGITPENIKALGELVDIHKDLSNEQYWEKKEEVLNMRYMRDDYRDDYGRRSRDSRGRYMGRGNYEGEDMIDEMREHYDNYMEGARYSGPEKEKAFDYMLK